MGKVLLIEDDGKLAKRIISKLPNEYCIEKAYDDSSAIDAWNRAEKENKPFKCIILDLNIKSDVMSDTLRNKYHGILGILLLNNFCDKKTLDVQKEIWAKTIVYSAFIDTLLEKEIMKNPPHKLEIIRKEDSNSITKVVNKVKEIVRRN